MQQTVEQTTEPTRTVEVAAEDLAGSIKGLPRLLTEDLTISVTGTAAIQGIEIVGLYGPGALTIHVVEGAEVTVQIQVWIDACTVPITLEGLRIIGKASPGGSICYVMCSPHVVVRNCVIDRELDINSQKSGVGATNGSNLLLDQCQITNCELAINCHSGSVVIASNCTGANNVMGIGTHGGTVLILGTTPELLGGSANSKGGGLIVKGDGTLL